MMSEMLAAWPSHSLLMRWCAVAKTDVRRRVAADDAADCGCSADGDGCTTWFRPNASRLLLALLQSCGRSALARHEREVMRTMQIAEGSEESCRRICLPCDVAPTELFGRATRGTQGWNIIVFHRCRPIGTVPLPHPTTLRGEEKHARESDFSTASSFSSPSSLQAPPAFPLFLSSSAVPPSP